MALGCLTEFKCEEEILCGKSLRKNLLEIRIFIDILVNNDLVGTNAIKNAVFCYNICTNNYVFFIIFNKNFTKIHKKMFVQK